MALTEITALSHRRAVRFFWSVLAGATLVSLAGNVAHAVLPYLPRIAIQVGASAVPPVVLLVAVHGVALAVRAGASGAVYRWAIAAVVAIGGGAFALSFIALCDLMLAIGYSPVTAWIFPAIIDTAVAVATLMLVALGDKPAPRTRTATGENTRTAPAPATRTKTAPAPAPAPAARPAPAPALRAVPDAGSDAGALARALVNAGATTKSGDQVEQILTAHAAGAKVTRIAADTGIHHKTVRSILHAADEHRQPANG